MATIKAVSSKASIGTAIDYIKNEEKTEEKLLSGYGCTPDTAHEEMQATKELWGKTDGRTYKHFVQSFAPSEKIELVQAHSIAKQLAENVPAWKGYEVLIATHNDTNHIHTHFIVNSVSYEDGHKLQWSKKDLQDMKDYSDKLCKENELSITQKGKTFEGADREETSAYTKETYQLLKKAEQGEVKSYVQDIALSVLECKEQATSRQDFIKRMNDKGFGVDWQDNHKYITFTDITRQEQGEVKCKIRNNKLEKYYNMEFGKEELERGFKVNARRKEQEQGTDREADRRKEQGGGTNIESFLRQLNADERASNKKRKDNKTQGANIESERTEERDQRAVREADRRKEQEQGANIESFLRQLNADERASNKKQEDNSTRERDQRAVREADRRKEQEQGTPKRKSTVTKNNRGFER